VRQASRGALGVAGVRLRRRVVFGYPGVGAERAHADDRPNARRRPLRRAAPPARSRPRRSRRRHHGLRRHPVLRRLGATGIPARSQAASRPHAPAPGAATARDDAHPRRLDRRLRTRLPRGMGSARRHPRSRRLQRLHPRPAAALRGLRRACAGPVDRGVARAAAVHQRPVHRPGRRRAPGQRGAPGEGRASRGRLPRARVVDRGGLRAAVSPRAVPRAGRAPHVGRSDAGEGPSAAA